MASSILNLFFCVSAAILVASLLLRLYNALYSPLRHIPGPYIARFTDLWYFYRLWLGHFEQDNIELHAKYGPIVRYGPNRFSFSHPEAAGVIYSVRNGSRFAKSSWYKAFEFPRDNPDCPVLFPMADIKGHAQFRRLFQSAYSMSALVSYEGYVDDCADLFNQRLREMSRHSSDDRSKISVDMGHWFQCYAFDVIGAITYSKRFGFLDQGDDKGNMMRTLDYTFHQGTLSGVIPWFEKLGFAGQTSGFKYLLDFTNDCIASHEAVPKNLDLGKENNTRLDLLSKFLANHREDPQRFNQWYVSHGCSLNILAGSDTTGISLSATLYNLMKHPEVAQKLRNEVDDFQAENGGSSHISFKDSEQMPYLQAIIKESLRTNPATGFPLERVVPDGGATIADCFFPAGTIVAVNNWVEHNNKRLFGSDADVFRPERWLESGPKELEVMNRHWMPFGMGARTCIGRQISMLEMCKLIPRIIRDFDFEFMDKEMATGKSWETSTYFFVKPKNFHVNIKARAK